MIKFLIKKHLTKLRRIIQTPKDFRYVFSNARQETVDYLLVIHESQELGASILTLHIAEELVHRGYAVCIISRQFGRMNDKYNQVTSLKVALTKKSYKSICKKIYSYGCRKALMITASTGDLVDITKSCGFEVVSMIHELEPVIQMLHLEKATKDMLTHSDKVLFSTTIARDQILNLCGVTNTDNIFVRPQGTYFKKPSQEIIQKQMSKLIDTYPVLKNKKIVAGIGNTTERKGFDIFLKTAVLMPELEFVWAGRKENYYIEALKAYGEPDNFVYLGAMNTEQLSGVYSIANVYLMCSRFDTLPSTIFEAQLFGLPIVGSKGSGGIVDVVNKSNGFLTDNANETQFAEAIGKLLSDDLKIESVNNSFEKYVDYVVKMF